MRPRTPLIVECRIPPRTRTPAARLLARWADAALGPRGAGHEMAIQVVSAPRMRELNRQYRGKDKPTNVLAFPATPAPGVRPRPLGDVVICATVLRQEAREQGKTETAHWAHLVVHGALHLAGYDHEIDTDATGAAPGMNTFVFDVAGDKGRGRLQADFITVDAGTERLGKGVLTLADGRRLAFEGEPPGEGEAADEGAGVDDLFGEAGQRSGHS